MGDFREGEGVGEEIVVGGEISRLVGILERE